MYRGGLRGIPGNSCKPQREIFEKLEKKRLPPGGSLFPLESFRGYYIQNRTWTPNNPEPVLTYNPLLRFNAMMYERPSEIGPNMTSAPTLALSPACTGELSPKL